MRVVAAAGVVMMVVDVVVIDVVGMLMLMLMLIEVVVRLRLHRAHNVARSAGLAGVRYWVMQFRLGRVGSSTVMSVGARPFCPALPS